MSRWTEHKQNMRLGGMGDGPKLNGLVSDAHGQRHTVGLPQMSPK